ncbi:hypothetical protein [Alkalihalobacterium sp. APHAB7]|uniref:hypothetical protein n=1 Tax=Alkalihalobacterium sp. APHAB7 TaxID=3402081 RepID=UPI003AACE6DD
MMITKSFTKGSRKLYFFFGCMFFVYTLLFGSATIYTGLFPAGHELLIFAMCVMSFCIAYLFPQFKDNDERSKRIRERGMFFSYFFILGYMIIGMGLFQLEVIAFDGYQTISILAMLTIVTVFLSFVILSRRY